MSAPPSSSFTFADRVSGPDSQPVRHLDRYHLLRNLGEGGMGTVFLAYDAEAGQQVALKMLSDRLARDRVYVERFFREARIGAAIDHPHVVRTLDFGRDAATGRHFMVLEYVDGPSCQYLLDRDGKMHVNDAALVVYHIAKALDELHLRSIVHRDVKPDNILLTSEGTAKLADFGLAKQLGGPDDLTAHQAGFGSSWYMPYEQAKNAGFVDARSDIFSLGATFYHLLTGQVPFPGENHAEVVARKQADHFRPASHLNPDVPPAIDGILARMLVLDPRRRFASIKQLIVELERTQLLNAYRVSVKPAGELGSAGGRVAGSVTSPDLNDRENDPGGENPWHLRYRHADGRVYTRRATTRQIQKGIKNGRWPEGTEAARSERRQFRPLHEYPEFAIGNSTDRVETRTSGTMAGLARSYRKLLVIAGFGVGLLVAATLASLLRGWMAGDPCEHPSNSGVCSLISEWLG